MSEYNIFDFGAGPVPAHRHSNGGGWVADTARVDASAHVGPNATRGHNKGDTQMTPKQDALYELNLLYAALDYPMVSEKKAEKMSIGVVKMNIDAAKKELAAA